MTVEKNLTVQEQHTYNTYLKSTRKNKGFTPRKNFDDIEDEKYIAIKKISATLRNKKIDPILFFEAPYIMHSERFVPLSYYSTFPAISVYRKYVREIQLTKPDAEFNIKQLRNSFKFIYEQCVKNDISIVEKYLEINKGMYPAFLLDLKSDNICLYSLLALGYDDRHLNLENKVVDFVYKDFYNVLSSLRSRYLSSNRIKPLSIKLKKTINNILKRK